MTPRLKIDFAGIVSTLDSHESPGIFYQKYSCLDASLNETDVYVCKLTLDAEERFMEFCRDRAVTVCGHVWICTAESGPTTVHRIPPIGFMESPERGACFKLVELQ